MKKAKKNNAVIIAGSILAVIVFACVFCRFFMTKDPTYMDLKNCNISPNKEFFFGTDTMGRDIFSMILYGGRIIAVYRVDIHRVIDYDCGDLRILQWNRTGVD